MKTIIILTLLLLPLQCFTQDTTSQVFSDVAFVTGYNSEDDTVCSVRMDKYDYEYLRKDGNEYVRIISRKGRWVRLKKTKSSKDCKYVISTHKNATLDEKEWRKALQNAVTKVEKKTGEKPEKRSSQIDQKCSKKQTWGSDDLSQRSKRWAVE